MLFSKCGPARFISHLDLVRTFARAIRRAGLPVAFSQGFNPHSIFSFAAPLPVGVEGEKECLDIKLISDVLPEQIHSLLGAVLPEGIKLGRVWQVPDNTPSPMSVVEKAVYEARVELGKMLTSAGLEERIKSFLGLSEILVPRKTKEGREKIRDIRPGIYALAGRVDKGAAVLEMELQAGSNGNVRPEEVVRAFVEQNALAVIPDGLTVIRTGLYPVY